LEEVHLTQLPACQHDPALFALLIAALYNASVK
jgi:hypothetical protein